MRIVPREHISASVWDNFVERHENGWFWHTTDWLQYQCAHYPKGREESFAVLDFDGRVAAVVPLFRSPLDVSAASAFCYGIRGLLPAGLVRDAIASSRAVAHVVSEAQRAPIVTRALLEYRGTHQVGVLRGSVAFPRAVACDVSARAVDLASVSWSGVRESYRSLIHRAEREYVIDSVSGDVDSTSTLFSAYQKLHRDLYGDPRPEETYRLQGKWLLEGRALVTVASDAIGTWVAAYWFIYKGEAYYGSGAYAVRNVSHAVVWRSLLVLRDLGATRAVLGYVGDVYTEKERAVEFFKRGFGGADEPVKRVSVEFA